jgi:ubiquinone/menaquinone biosynthesis C-methylase UbiE
MEPHLGRRILEIGCGTGNMTGFLADRGDVLAMDVEEGYLRTARKRFKDRRNIRFKNMTAGKGWVLPKTFRPDTIVCVNVLEHILDDLKVLKACRSLLSPGGKVLVFVPALPWLYGSMDESYGHHRRYEKAALEALMAKAGLRVLDGRYLNLLGVLGWWLNGKVLRRPIVPKGQMMLYDAIVGVVGKFERFLPRPIGLSLFCAAVKEG